MNKNLKLARLGCTAAGVLLVVGCLGCGSQPEPSTPRADPVPVAQAKSTAAPVTSRAPSTTAPSIDETNKAVEDARRIASPKLPPMEGPSVQDRLTKGLEPRKGERSESNRSSGGAGGRLTEPLSEETKKALDDLFNTDLFKEVELANQKAEAAAEAQRNPKFYVAYHYATETDRDDIEVRNSALLYTDLGPIDPAERPAPTNPTASRPLHADADLIHFQGTLSAPQVAALTKLLHDIAFLKLKEHYGGPAPGDPSHNETFKITLNGQQKQVAYHHHPTAEPMPEELVKLRTELFRLVHQKFRLNPEQGRPR